MNLSYMSLYAFPPSAGQGIWFIKKDNQQQSASVVLCVYSVNLSVRIQTYFLPRKHKPHSP